METMHFDELMKISNALYAKLKVVLVKGTAEEKKAILRKIRLVRHLMQKHYEALKSQLNLNPDELKLALQLAMAKSPEFRKKLSTAKEELDRHKEDLIKITAPLKRKGRLKPLKNRWLRS